MDEIDRFFEPYRATGAVESVAAAIGASKTEAGATLDRLTAQARLGIDIAARIIDIDRPTPGQRILEIGAGSGLVALYLKHRGHDIAALEPAGCGFDLYAALPEALAGIRPTCAVPRLAIGAEALDPAAHGRFDRIFSIYALEHMPDLPGAIAGMARVLAPDGRMVHIAPNYACPYEPHFGIPLLPFWPSATRHILPKRIVQSDLWRSLNFVTARRLARLLRDNGRRADLAPAQMHATIERLSADPEFAKRHEGLARLFGWPGVRHGAALLKAWPAALATPMVVEAG